MTSEERQARIVQDAERIRSHHARDEQCSGAATCQLSEQMAYIIAKHAQAIRELEADLAGRDEVIDHKDDKITALVARLHQTGVQV